MSGYSVEKIYAFLKQVDSDFAVPLSKKQDLAVLASKFAEKATLCAEEQGGEIAAMVAGYTENLIGGIAYISVVATSPRFRGKGLASKCVLKFIGECRNKNIQAVHLYTDAKNTAARAMYKKIGFVDYICENEPRPCDVHLIYRLEKEGGQ